MGWIYLPSVSIQNGSNIVTVNNTATDSIKPGDGLLIGAYDLVEIIEVSIGQLKLKKNWSSASQSNAESAVVPTFGDFNAATAALRQATTITQGNFAEMEKWWTQIGQVTFKAYNNTEHTVRTAKQMEQDVSKLEAETRDLIGELAVVGYFPSESQFEVMREQNQSKFAASDFVYHGKHPASGGNYATIGEGLSMGLSSEEPNRLLLGMYSGGVGKSKTEHPVFNAAGVLLNVLGINKYGYNGHANTLFLPPAPDGTVTYDSATGVVTNFKKDAGHYAGVAGYETVAERTLLSGLSEKNEAVASAFEGEIKNGDFRFGSSWWTNANVVDGKLFCQAASAQSRTQSFVWDETAKYEVTVVCSEYTSGQVSIVKHGVGASDGNIMTISGVGTFTTIFDPTSVSGNNSADNLINIYNSGIVDLVIDSISVRKITNQVVTDRVDMTGLEIFAEEVKNGEVFPVCIQNLNSNVIAGVPMRLSTRPKSYFQVYDGQYPDNAVNNAFYCWDWPALTTAQKAQVADYLKGTAFVNSAGNSVQWRVRNRSFAGAGNGDWSFSGQVGAPLWFDEQAKICVSVKGVKNSSSDFVSSSGEWFQGWNTADSVKDNPKLTSNGVYQPRRGGNNAAYNGECYFYVIATVPRLNQGAHHPELNPMGARRPRIEAVGTNFWHGLDSSVFSKKYCFMAQTNGIVPIGFNSSTGNISSAISGHPDGKFYDAIYPSGQGGVIDHRLKYGAWDASSYEQAAVVREEVKNGTYRGREKLVFTHIQMGTQSSAAASTNAFTVDNVSKFVVGDSVSIVSDGVIVVKDRVVTSIGSSNITFNGDGIPRDVKSYYFVVTTKTNITVEGAFSQTDVIGNPANILQCPALKDGWFGSWIPKIPDGTTQVFEMTSPVKSTLTRQYTSDNGVTWASSTFASFNSFTNSETAVYGADRVAIYNYTSEAKPTVASGKLPVFNGEFGVSMFVDVLNSSSINYGALLAHSTLELIVKGQLSSTTRQRLKLQELSIDYLGNLSADNVNLLIQKHDTIGNLDSSNNTHAAKFLVHQINESDQANLNLIANELIYSSTASNWGDDSKIKVLTDATFTDLNGNKCKAVIHKLAKPYGFIQNKI
ncbi:hypothetical protein [Vibrio fluvialis]|uniref:hypothetical protein n=1 Tax=Vibrio fluvialis TaxID=676 RepID=UPI0006981478|nr:hypothetical protein [Vibrio fluvialis]